MLLMTPCRVNQELRWRQTRLLGFERGDAIVGRFGRLLALIGEPESAEAISAQSGRRCHLAPGQNPLDLPPELWIEDSSINALVEDAAWREEERVWGEARMSPRAEPQRPLNIGSGERARDEQRWFWSERLSRWESPALFMAPSRGHPKEWSVDCRMIAAASALWVWDQDALRLSEGWPRELSEADFLSFSLGMSAEGMRLCQTESFSDRPMALSASMSARWLSALEAKELEESAKKGSGSCSLPSSQKRL